MQDSHTTMQGENTNLQDIANKTCTVHIERMAFGNAAIARSNEGKTIFVEGGAPGDVACVRIFEEKASFSKAYIEDILEPSPLRSKQIPSCCSACGGCPWAHLSYEAQCDAKQANVTDALCRIGHLDAGRVSELVLPILPSKKQWGYRNKLELGVGTDAQGKLILGMFEEGTHKLANITNCPIANKLIASTPKSLQGALRFLEGASQLGVFRLGVRGSVRTGSAEVALWTPPSAFPRAQVAKTLSSAGRFSSIVRVLAQPGKARRVKKVERLAGKGFWEESLCDARFLTSAPSFFQVNTAQAEKLVNTVMAFLGDVEDLYIADLYAGGGTFSIPLALAGAQVIAVESAKSSVADLRRNAELNGVFVDAVCGDAAEELPRLGSLDALVVDPPRAGLAESMIASIGRAHPRHIAYISCNPTTLARDIARFEASGYTLARVQPVDLFPQTYHVETVALLSQA